MERDEGSGWPNGQTNLVSVFHELSQLFCHFINATVSHLCQVEPSSHSTKELYGVAFMLMFNGTVL